MSERPPSLRSTLREQPSAGRFLRVLTSVLAVACALAVSRPVSAQLDTPDENPQTYMVGGRAAGMGGAFTAIADDESGMFYNPAGLAHAERSSLSLTVSLYGFVHSRATGALPDGGNAGYSDINIVPSTFGSVKKLSDKYAIAFGVFSPSSLSYKDQRRLAGGGLYVTSIKDETLWAGAAFSAKLSERLSLGLSVFGIYRSSATETTMLAGATPSTTQDTGGRLDEYGRFIEVRESDDQKAYGATLLLGVRYQVSDVLAFGASLHPGSFHLAGSGKYLFTIADSHSDQNGPLLQVADGRYGTSLTVPPRLAMGLAAGTPRSWTVALDYSVHLAVDVETLDDQGQPHVASGRITQNVNLGGEFWPHDRLALRVGAFTNRSSTPADVIEAQSNHVDEYGGALGIGIISTHTETTLGVNATYGVGDGYTQRYDASSDSLVGAVVDVRRFRAYFFAGTSYRF